MNNKRLQLAILFAIALPAGVAGAATHIFINPDVFSGSTDHAFVDISGEPGSADLQITAVSPAGVNQTTVPMNAANFATSPDLFGMSSGRSAIIIAQTRDTTAPSVAVLRQQSGTNKTAVTIPSSNRMLGRAFNLPLGDLSSGPNNIYVANPNPSDTRVAIQFGGSNSPVDTIVTIRNFSIAKIAIAATHQQTNMLVSELNGVPVVAEAAFGSRIVVVLPIVSAVDGP